MNKTVAFLSIDNARDFEYFDHLLIDPLNKLGWVVEEISWRKNFVDWNKYLAVIVRSTWDYQSDPDKFLAVLEEINNSSAHLENAFATLKWNMNKRYIHDLENMGVRIVKTIWQKGFHLEKVMNCFYHFKMNEIIIKPAVSACAENTFRLSQNNFLAELDTLHSLFKSREFMV